MCVLASQKITERFSRNPEKPADEDVAERVFLITEERIQLRYHCRDDHITASKREFLQRSEVDSKGNKIIMTPDMCISFEVSWAYWPGWGVRPVEWTKRLGPCPAPYSAEPRRALKLAQKFTSAPRESPQLLSGDPSLSYPNENQ